MPRYPKLFFPFKIMSIVSTIPNRHVIKFLKILETNTEAGLE